VAALDAYHKCSGRDKLNEAIGELRAEGIFGLNTPLLPLPLQADLCNHHNLSEFFGAQVTNSQVDALIISSTAHCAGWKAPQAGSSAGGAVAVGSAGGAAAVAAANGHAAAEAAASSSAGGQLLERQRAMVAAALVLPHEWGPRTSSRTGRTCSASRHEARSAAWLWMRCCAL
jgi:hypothetical protein